ncbi:MAG: hypothetical protein EBS53_00025 [Bacteroidetes bacterium]|nr:hypothetical protein [Bacteroidota bacterium]
MAITVELPLKLLDAPKNLRKKLPATLRRIAMEGKSFWKAEAGRRLKSSRQKYQEAISVQLVDDMSFFLALTGPFAYGIEEGRPAFDMKPGLMRNALPWPPKKRKFPRAIAATLRPKSPITQYRIVPLNVHGYVNLTKPRVFRTIHDQTTIALSGPNAGKPAWQHPGNVGIKLADEVVRELTDNIIPKHMSKLLTEVL